jgi:type I restriction enzyme S subunit
MDMRRRQMALLKEQRAALIQEAVTRGLNSNASMKDSGLPWLGEIPAHWKTVSLGYLATLLQTGPFGSQLHASEYITDGIPVINPSHMSDGLICPDQKCTVSEFTAKNLSRHFLQIGDIVFARRGELGRCALVHAEEAGWICGTGSLLMRPDTRMIVPAYLVTLFKLQQLKESLTLQSVGSTMDNLNTGILSCTGLPLPPLCEQEDILNFIEKQEHKFNCLHRSYARQLELLTEYRAALIHECVTGQRSVPEVTNA